MWRPSEQNDEKLEDAGLLSKERLLAGDPDVLSLFAADPFAQPPREVRAVLWQYWFTSMEQKHATGDWWTRKLLGAYAPVLERDAQGGVTIVTMPDALPQHD